MWQGGDAGGTGESDAGAPPAAGMEGARRSPGGKEVEAENGVEGRRGGGGGPTRGRGAPAGGVTRAQTSSAARWGNPWSGRHHPQKEAWRPLERPE